MTQKPKKSKHGENTGQFGVTVQKHVHDAVVARAGKLGIDKTAYAAQIITRWKLNGEPPITDHEIETDNSLKEKQKEIDELRQFAIKQQNADSQLPIKGKKSLLS